MLGASKTRYWPETVYTRPMLEQLLDREFVPCAVICTKCDGRAEIGDLTLYADFSGVGLCLQKDP